ncbi:Peroxisomal biogenesis factor 3 [Seminavis robusta]|uniref:Peroxisomal biogenesis factor 3 n=1 Tax=Seminavis robusta TaxID=568900 RepID=A0A9N8DF51_9STRA|nr:Peroxisomal biogenesis factor 3 [Seminavis robusta]|eukprot:Sro120_g058370.1 Peroxisomal biogenesis factor 3 (399) ;mRNA; r:31382-32578
MQPNNNSRRRRYETPGVATLASAGLAAYGTYCLANWAWNQWYKKEGDDSQQRQQQQHDDTNIIPMASHPSKPLGRERSPMSPQQWRSRRQRMVRCGDEVARALEGLLPSLKRAIEEATPTIQETQALKQLKTKGQHSSQQAMDLWETVKVRSVTRLVATAYAHSILVLVVTVQIHLLGGKLFEEQLHTDNNNTNDNDDSTASDLMSTYGESHKEVLHNTYKYYFEQGVPALIQSVETSVQSALADWKFSDASCLHITRGAFDQALQRIRQQQSLEERRLLQYLVPSAGMSLITDAVSDEMARWILYETWDVLESPVVAMAHRDCLDVTFERMKHSHWTKIFDESTTGKPLALIISKLKHTSRSFFEFQQQHQTDAVNGYYLEMQCLPSVMELADVSFG